MVEKLNNKLLQNYWKKLNQSDSLEMDIVNNGLNKLKKEDYMLMRSLLRILRIYKLQVKYLLIWASENKLKLMRNIKI